MRNAVQTLIGRSDEDRFQRLRRKLQLHDENDKRHVVFGKSRVRVRFYQRTNFWLIFSVLGACTLHGVTIWNLILHAKYKVKLSFDRRKYLKKLDEEEKLWDQMDTQRSN